MTTAVTPAPIAVPPGYEDYLAGVVAQLRHPLVREPRWTPQGARHRRWLTRTDPLRFALVYLGPYVTDRDGLISFCRFHLDAVALIAGWADRGPSRHAVAAWRDAGKSTLFNLIGLLWAVGHGYVRYPYLISLTGDQARGKLRRALKLLRGQHACSALLLADFPELALARSAAGRYELAGGAILNAHGLLGETLARSATSPGRTCC